MVFFLCLCFKDSQKKGKEKGEGERERLGAPKADKRIEIIPFMGK